MDENRGMDFLDSGVDEVASTMDSGAGAGEALGEVAPSSPPGSTTEGGLSSPVASAPPSDPWAAMPKSWKQELAPHWEGLAPDVKQYVHTREKQALDGLMQYKQQVDAWEQALNPFQPWIEQAKLDPRDVTTRMLNAHLVLTQGTPEQKRQVAQALIQDYGLEELLRGAGGEPPTDPLAPVRQLLHPLAEKVSQLEQMTAQERAAKTDAEVNAFLGDPKNEFAKEVVPDMIRLLKAGLASDLQSAYVQACRLNTEVSKKLFEREIQSATKPSRPAPTNVTSSPVPPAPTAKPERSIEEEMSNIFDEIINR